MSASALDTLGRADLGPFPAPHALAEAVVAVSRAHPYTERGVVEPDSPRLAVDAEALWNRLAALRPRALATEVDALSEIDLHTIALTARGQLADPARRTVLSTVLLRREVPGGPALAWEAWLATDGEPGFRGLAAEHAGTSPARATWSSLLEAERPSEAAARLWADQLRGVDAWAAAPDVGLGAYPAFVDRVRRHLLLSGYFVALYRRENGDALARWAATLVPTAERDAWYAAFLNETAQMHASQRPPGRWPAAQTVCGAILNRYRMPADSLPFWEQVTPDARAAFTLWRVDYDLTRLLGGENERVAFWRRYLPEITKVERNSDKLVVFIHFAEWYAVQFRLTGTATYCFRYRERQYRHLKSDTEVRLKHFVRGNAHLALAAYDHRGYTSTWQTNAAEAVARAKGRLVEGTP